MDRLDSAELGDAGPLWHPFADMARIADDEITMTKGEGCWVWDSEGRNYLDATAGLWYCNVGHGRPELAMAAERQMRYLAAYQTFDVFANQPALDLAERVCTIAELEPPAAAFFTNGGSDAIDTAAKIVRRYWQLADRPERRTIISRGGAYHGMNAFGTSLAGIEANATGWGPLIQDVIHIPHDSLEALDTALQQHAHTIGAFIGEPVLGAGGVHPPSDDYWPGVQDLCREHDILLLLDEVVTGFGRLGHWFASQRFGIEPDMIVAAKGLTSGYLPAGVVICGRRILDQLWAPEAGPFRHGYTYSGHPTACAVGLVNLDIIEREQLRQRVTRLEPVLAEHLTHLAGHPLVDEVRHIGLLAGIQLAAAELELQPGLANRMVSAVRERGVLVRNLMGNTLQISPPFTITESEIRLMTKSIASALDTIYDQSPAAI